MEVARGVKAIRTQRRRRAIYRGFLVALIASVFAALSVSPALGGPGGKPASEEPAAEKSESTGGSAEQKGSQGSGKTDGGDVEGDAAGGESEEHAAEKSAGSGNGSGEGNGPEEADAPDDGADAPDDGADASDESTDGEHSSTYTATAMVLETPMVQLEHGSRWLSASIGEVAARKQVTCTLAGETIAREGRRHPFHLSGNAQCTPTDSEDLTFRYGRFELRTPYFTRPASCEFAGVLGIGRLRLENGFGSRFDFNFTGISGAGPIDLFVEDDGSQIPARGYGAVTFSPIGASLADVCERNAKTDRFTVRAEVLMTVIKSG